MTASSPYHFRPMDELFDEGVEVEMVLRGTGEVVIGCLFCGVPRSARSFWGRSSRGESIRLDPIGWRDPPTPEAVAAWKEASAA